MRIVGYLDMDAFFAAIEERHNPSLHGLPIVVGADPRGGKGQGWCPPRITRRASTVSIQPCRSQKPGGCRRPPGSKESPQPYSCPFEQDTRDAQFLIEWLGALCQDVMGRLTGEGFTHFRTVVLTVRVADFETKSRSHRLPVPANAFNLLQLEAMNLLLPFLDHRENPQGKLIRLLGVRIEKVERFGVHAQAPLIE
jgi:nucleotidyltransferase/DNA polymerase involved in DNA repair